MEQEELGKSGIRVSRIGVGMWQAGGKNPWGDDVNDEDSIASQPDPSFIPQPGVALISR